MTDGILSTLDEREPAPIVLPVHDEDNGHDPLCPGPTVGGAIARYLDRKAAEEKDALVGPAGGCVGPDYAGDGECTMTREEFAALNTPEPITYPKTPEN